jgi:hypothetical protein
MFSIIFTSMGQAEQYNCKGLDQEHQKIVQQINKKCDNSAQCLLDILDWTACGSPQAHSDRDMASELLKTRNEIHKICQYVRAPCPAVRTKAHCVSQTCFTQEELWEKDYKISVIFFLNDQPLSNSEILADYDNGIRCVSAPCPARTIFAHYQTDGHGEIKLDVNQFTKGQAHKTNAEISVNHGEMDLSKLRFIHNNQHFSNFNLHDFLAKNRPPFKLEVRWTK